MGKKYSLPLDGASALPPDDTSRELGVARPNTDPSLKHIAIAGDTYTVLLTGE